MRSCQFLELVGNHNQGLHGYIPALPAVAMLNEQDELVYLGPYSTGMYCSQGNGIIEPYIQGKRVKSNGPIIPYDAQGCYCKNVSKPV